MYVGKLCKLDWKGSRFDKKVSYRQKNGMENKKPLIVLSGATAVGKTKLSIALAKSVGGEIISADSMQVYRGMDIGTAKIGAAERQGVPHHLIDVLEPEEDFNVTLFQQLAEQAIDEIYSRGRIPIIVGGTGFYIQAVTNAVDFTETKTDFQFREELQHFAAFYGAAALHQKLCEADPVAASQIHENNIKRTIRALEYYHQTGKKISEHNQEQKSHTSPYELSYFVLTAPRNILYEKINVRVDQMIKDGLLSEVERLRERGLSKTSVSMQGLGYKELLEYLEGRQTLPETIDQFKKDTEKNPRSGLINLNLITMMTDCLRNF